MKISIHVNKMIFIIFISLPHNYIFVNYIKYYLLIPIKIIHYSEKSQYL